MKFHIHNLKFRNQISLVFLIIFFLSNVGAGIAFYHISARQITDNFSENAESAMGQIQNTLETQLEIINKRAEAILINNTFATVMTQYLNNPTSANRVLALGMVSDYLKDFERGEALIDSSYLAAGQLMFDSYVHHRRHDFDFWTSPFYTVYQDSNMKSVQWFGTMDNLIFQTGHQVVPCVRRFQVRECNDWLYFVYQLDQKELRKLVMGNKPFFDDIVILDEQENQIIGESLISSAELLEFWDDRTDSLTVGDSTPYLVSCCYISKPGWKVFALKSEQELLARLRQLRADILKMIFLLFAASMTLVILNAKHLTDELGRLERQMACARDGDFSVRFFYPYKDEIGSLSESFNYMIEEIQNLVQKQNQSIADLRTERDHVVEMQKQKRKAELKALQAQINPHFLYNILNAITWQAADQGMDDVSLMASSLGKFFRLSLSKGSEIISLSSEVEHIRNYLNIQGIRYQDKLHYEIDIPEEILECKVLKLILQPLVENAIYHGIKEKTGGGLIRITAVQDHAEDGDIVSLMVWDDGVGIPKDQLAVMNRNLKNGAAGDSESYGIYNVNERIRLYYGSRFGLSYESEPGSYTRAVLMIPVQYWEVE